METAQLNFFFSVLALLCWAGVSLVLIAYGVGRLSPTARDRLAPWSDEASRFALPLAWLVAVVATAGSLYYSEIADFIPCTLCWYQRIAMYPLSLILGVAVIARDRAAWRYVLPLSLVGAAVSIYHYQLEVFPEQGHGACDPTVPCSTRYFEEFGFVSLSFMALSGFVFITTMVLVARKK